MISQKQTSTALFTLCLGTFLALLGCSVITSFVVAFIIGLVLLGISHVKRSLLSATTVIDTDSSCSVTVKRNDQKSVLEPSFLGKAHVTPTKNVPTGVTPNVQEVKQVLNFKSVGNSSMSTPVKNLNKSVIKLKNSHFGTGAWPLNSTPIEKKSVLVEQNYHMMKAINNTQQSSPYSVKRAAVEKECSPPVVSQHKKPKTLPLLKEGRALRIPTVYVVHKKAENILKTKGNKRFLENNENVNDPKRRNKEDGDVEKPQKRKLLSIVHITGKKHKVPSINSPTKYSRNTDLVVTNDDLEEDRRRNEERVRKLLAHKDEENVAPTIKPAKETATDNTVNLQIPNKADTNKSVTLFPSDKENTAPTVQLTTNDQSQDANENNKLPSAETPKALPKPSSSDTSLISTDSKVVKSLFGNPSDSDKTDSITSKSLALPAFSVCTSTVKSEQPTVVASNSVDVKPSFSFGSTESKPLNSIPPKISELSKTVAVANFSFGGLSSNTVASTEKQSASVPKTTFSLGSSSQVTAAAPSLSFGKTSLSSSAPLTTSQTKIVASSFSFGGSLTTSTASLPILTSLSDSKSVDAKPAFSFGAATLATSAAIPAAETKPSFSFGPASTSTSKPTSFSFGGSSGSTSSLPLSSTTPSTGFSFGSSTDSNATTLTFGSNSATSTFGATSTTSAFGTTSTAPTFGTTLSSAAPSTGFSFGSSTASNQSTALSFGTSTTTPAFGSGPVAPTFAATSTASTFGTSSSCTVPVSTGFSFGSSTTSNTPAPAFGSSSAAPSTGFSFGSAASSTTPAFGSTANSVAPAFGASSAIQAFGASSATSTFGSSSSTGSIFGSTTNSAISSLGSSNPTSTSTFSFGGTIAAPSNPAPASSGFSFGGTTSSNAAGTFNFGSSSSKSEGFNFGGTATPAPVAGGFNFGATPSNAPPTNSAVPGNMFSSPTTPSRRIATPRRRKPR